MSAATEVRAPSRKPGRPRDTAKRCAILLAARRLFLQQGMAGVTMEAVAAAAGVSKMTLYSRFRDKEALFEAVVVHTSEGMIAEMSRTQAEGGTLAESLAALGRAFLALTCSPEMVGAERGLMMALHDNPALAERFYAAGPARTQASVAAVLGAAAERGEIRLDDPLEAASDLLALWQGGMCKRLSLGLETPLSPEQIAARSQAKTEMFLRACAVGTPDRPCGGTPDR
jgi:TetR/AcrR family transcriptional repressor of mexJK operon